MYDILGTDIGEATVWDRLWKEGVFEVLFDLEDRGRAWRAQRSLLQQSITVQHRGVVGTKRVADRISGAGCVVRLEVDL